MADRKRARRVSFAAEEEDEDERRGRDAAQRRCALLYLSFDAYARLLAVAKQQEEDEPVQQGDGELILPPLGEWEADACKAITLRLGAPLSFSLDAVPHRLVSLRCP